MELGISILSTYSPTSVDSRLLNGYCVVYKVESISQLWTAWCCCQFRLIHLFCVCGIRRIASDSGVSQVGFLAL